MEHGPEAVDLAAAIVTAPTRAADWLVIAPLVLPLIAGSILLMLRRWQTAQPILAVAALGVHLVLCALLLLEVLERGPITMTMGRWLPPFGIAFTVDVLGATLTTVAAAGALAVAVYAVRDVPSGLRRYGFYPFLLLMMTGVSGAFLTGDLFNLYVWFEVLLISSFGLIVLGNSRAQLDGALRYALLNFIATTLFLVAVGYVYGVLGTLNMADIRIRAAALDDPTPLYTVAALFILAFGTKAAAFPVHFWLPASYHTPAIATAAIFAGLLTKVGAYALLRVLIMLMPAERALYSDLLAWVAAATMMLGGLGALAQSDMRRMLGYFVITGIGGIVAGIAIGSSSGIAGAVIYAVHSMVAMTAIYLAVGIAGRVGGSFDLARLGGLYLTSPLLAAIILVLVFAVAGLPPFSGFWPKVAITRAALADGFWWLAAAVLASGFLTTIAGGRAFALAFWRADPVGRAEAAREVLPARDATLLYAPAAGLTVLVVLLGVWPAPLLHLGNLSAAALLDPSSYIQSVFGGGP